MFNIWTHDESSFCLSNTNSSPILEIKTKTLSKKNYSKRKEMKNDF